MWGLPAGLAVALSVGVILSRQVFWEGGRPVRVILVDDAMISMGFARSLAEGCGLVWYCGYPRVQGYTNLGWTLYMALWHKAGLSPEYASVPILLTSLGLLIGYVYGVYRLGKLFGSGEVGRWAAWIAALFPPVIFHFSKGLEAGLLAMLGVYFLVELLGGRRVWLLAWMAAVGTFVRLDFVLWVGALLVGDRLRRGDFFQRRDWGLMLFSGGAALVVTLGVLGWQRAYYGSWLPNTYFLKVSSIPSWMRWANGALATAMHMGINLPLYLIALWGVWRRRLWREAAPLLTAFGASVLYNIHVGGDIYEDSASSNRFLLNGFFSAFVLAGWTLSRASKPWLAMAGLALISYGLPLSPNLAYRWRMLWRHDERSFYIPVARYFSEGDTLYIAPAGTTPYFFRRYVWRDLMGKVESFVPEQMTFIICNGPLPLWYFAGHTYMNLKGLLREGKACLGCTLLESHLCGLGSEQQVFPTDWRRRLLSWLSPCYANRPLWHPFPTDSVRRCFCTQFEWVEPFSWKRRRPPGTCGQ